MKKILTVVIMGILLFTMGCVKDSEEKENLSDEQLMAKNFKQFVTEMKNASSMKKATAETVEDGVYVDKDGKLVFYTTEYLIKLNETELNLLISDLYSATSLGKRACIIYSNRSLAYENMAKYTGPQDFTNEEKSLKAVDVIALIEPVFEKENAEYVEASGDKVTIVISDKTIIGIGNSENIVPSAELTAVTFTYVSNNTGIVTVDVNGKLIAIAKGSTTVSIVGSKDGKEFNRVDFNVTVDFASDAKLSTMEVEGYEISPVFSATVLDYTLEVKNNIESIKVKAIITDKNASLKIKDKAVVSGDYSEAIALVVGDNEILLVVSAEDGVSEKTYKLTVKREALIIINKENKIMSIGSTIASGVTTDPAGANLNYISSNESIVTVVDGNLTAVAKGEATITVSATATGYTQNTTSFTIKVNNNDAKLSGISISQGTLSPAFSTETILYNVTVENNIETINVMAELSDGNASLKIAETAKNSAEYMNNIALAVGNNPIEVKVTAEDGISEKTYTVTVKRKEIVVLTVTNKELGVKETISAGLVANPVDANVSYVSSDETIATVDASGNITGVKEGTVTITINASKDGYTSKTSQITVTVEIKIDATITKGSVLSTVFQQYHIDFVVNHSDVTKVEIYASSNKIGESTISSLTGTADIITAVGTTEITLKALKSDGTLIKELNKTLD